MRAIAADSSALEQRQLAPLERRRDDGVGPLEEVVDDLDLVGAGAEARERVDEPLQPVVVLDDLVGRRLRERVRLVVEHERARALAPEHVEAPVQEDAVVLERERPLRPRRPSSVAMRAASSDSQYAATNAAIRASSSSVTAGYQVRTISTSGALGAARSTSSSRRCTASPISVAFSPRARPAPCRAPRAGRRRARRSSGTSSARRARAPSTRDAARGAAAAARQRHELRQAVAARRGRRRELGEERELARVLGRRRLDGLRPAAAPSGRRRGRSARRRARARPARRPRARRRRRAPSRSSTQPIGVSRSCGRSRSIAPDTIRRSIGARHRDVVEAQPLGAILAPFSASRTSS